MNNGEKCGKQGKHTDFNPVNEAMDHLSTVFTGTVVSTRCSWLLCIIPEVFPVSISMFPSGTLSNSGSAWLVNMLVSWVEERKVVEWICSFLKKERVCFHRSMKSENRDWNENMTEKLQNNCGNVFMIILKMNGNSSMFSENGTTFTFFLKGWFHRDELNYEFYLNMRGLIWTWTWRIWYSWWIIWWENDIIGDIFLVDNRMVTSL